MKIAERKLRRLVREQITRDHFTVGDKILVDVKDAYGQNNPRNIELVIIAQTGRGIFLGVQEKYIGTPDEEEYAYAFTVRDIVSKIA